MPNKAFLLIVFLLTFIVESKASMKVCTDKEIINLIGQEKLVESLLDCSQEFSGHNFGYLKNKKVAVLLDKEVSGKIFYFSYPRIHSIQFYNYVDGNLENMYAYEKTNNNGQEYVVIDNIGSKNSKIVALVQTGSSLQIPYLTFDSHDKFRKFFKNEQIFEGLWFGVMLFTSLIALIIYFIKKNPEILYFFTHLFSLIVVQSAFSGFFYSYFSFFPEYFLQRLIIFFLCTLVIGSVGLIYTNFKRNRKWIPIELYKVNNVLALGVLILTAFSYGQLSIKLTSYLMLIFSSSTLLVCLFSAIKKYENSVILLASFSFFLFSTLAFTLKDLGVIGINEIYLDNWVKVGFFAEIMLISAVILKRLIKEQDILKEALINKEISNNARTIQHDIKSPLSSLNYLLETAKSKLSESERVIANESLTRIEDIVNILDKGDRLLNNSIAKQALYPLVSMIVSEKRVEYKNNHKIEINLVNNLDYGVFVSVDKSLFSRAISNVINNSVEATRDDGNIFVNVIDVELSNDHEKCIIKIKDNGIGIKEDDLARVLEGGKSINKANGHGIGISVVKELVATSNGDLSVKSEFGVGTEIKVELPRTSTPKWFEEKLMLKHKKICILDDDESIHSVWKNLLIPHGVELVHFYDISMFKSFMKSCNLDEFYFLMDYTLIGTEVTGLELISQYGLNKKSTLVTSSYNDRDVQKRATALGVKIIPKESARFIDISVLESKRDIVLIDDDRFLHKIWTLASSDSNCSLACYSSISEFLDNYEKHQLHAEIYVDENISALEKGSIDSEKIYLKGFKNIFLNTSDVPREIPYWVKSTSNKEFPLQ